MPIDLVAEESLRAALEQYRPHRARFAAEVEDRIRTGQEIVKNDPLERLSPLSRAAAVLLPGPLLGGNAPAAVAPLGGVQKLLGLIAVPAMSLLVLFGATVFSFRGIRRVQRGTSAEPMDSGAMEAAASDWWQANRWRAYFAHGVTVVLMLIGASSLIFGLYIVSIAILVFAVRSLAQAGIGNRQIVGRSCGMVLMLLGQCMISFSIGEGDIHFLDQRLIGVVFLVGSVVLFLLSVGRPLPSENALQRSAQRTGMIAAAVLIALIAGWFTFPLLWPATPQRIKHYVEAFDAAPHGAVSWMHWEIPAQWTIDAGLQPDLAGARQLLDAEIAGEQNSMILSIAFQLGLVRREDIARLRDLGPARMVILSDTHRVLKDRPLLSLNSQGWVISALLMRNELSDDDRDYLAGRLRAALQQASLGEYGSLHDALLATQLLRLIDRPVTPAEYRKQIHSLLRKLHSTDSGGFTLAGGFRISSDPRITTSDPLTTAYAVELMQIHGIPDGMDINWIRSYVRPRALAPDKWISAVTRRRLDALPDAPPLAWWQVIYYERNLLAAFVIVALCGYATISSPWAAEPNAVRDEVL